MLARTRYALLMGAFISAIAANAPTSAQQAAPPVDPNAIILGTGGVENGAAEEIWYGRGVQLAVRNVTQSTLTPVLPDKDKATGAAVIVAPGGAYRVLSMNNEGWPIAHWLADHGIAAFVLKYRLMPTPADPPAFAKVMASRMAEMAQAPADTRWPAFPPAVEDVEAALKLVRTHAADWGVDPGRVGLMGFSAGARTILAATLQATPDGMPAFIAPVYGPMNTETVPEKAPPLFAVMAIDDPLQSKTDFGLIQSWRQAHRPVELHVYQKDGHGFGAGYPGTTAAAWLDSFLLWLRMNKILPPST